MTDSETMVFDDLEPISVKVEIKKVQYVLKEADEAASIKFRNFMSRNVTYQEGGVARIENQGEAPALLVSLCLFKVSQDREGKDVHVPVHIADIKKWKTSLVSSLYRKARQISGMDDEEETVESIDKQIDELTMKREKLLDGMKEKNSSPATEGSSS